MCDYVTCKTYTEFKFAYSCMVNHGSALFSASFYQAARAPYPRKAVSPKHTEPQLTIRLISDTHFHPLHHKQRLHSVHDSLNTNFSTQQLPSQPQSSESLESREYDNFLQFVKFQQFLQFKNYDEFQQFKQHQQHQPQQPPLHRTCHCTSTHASVKAYYGY